MAVVGTAKEIWENRGGLDEATGARNRTRTFRVIVDSRFDRESTVLSAAGLPKLFEGHPDAPLVFCRALRPITTTETPLVWIVECEYSNEFDPRQQASSSDPLARQAEVEWDSADYEEQATEDTNGRALTNSAGDPPEPFPPKPSSHRVAMVEKNLAGAPPFLLDYESVLNSDRFVIDGLPIEPLTALCRKVKVSRWKREGDFQRFKTVVIHIEIRKKGWKAKFLDQGFYELVENSSGKSERRLITDDNGEPVSKAVLLDGHGKKMDPELIKLIVDLYGSYPGFHRSFDIIPTKPFSVLPLQ